MQRELKNCCQLFVSLFKVAMGSLGVLAGTGGWDKSMSWEKGFWKGISV